MPTYRQRVLAKRTRTICSSLSVSTEAAAAIPAHKPLAYSPAVAESTGRWKAIKETTASGGAHSQRPYVVIRQASPEDIEYLLGQGGRKRRFGSLDAAAVVADEANRETA
jgi:hypothetical protein